MLICLNYFFFLFSPQIKKDDSLFYRWSNSSWAACHLVDTTFSLSCGCSVCGNCCCLPLGLCTVIHMGGLLHHFPVCSIVFWLFTRFLSAKNGNDILGWNQLHSGILLPPIVFRRFSSFSSTQLVLLFLFILLLKRNGRHISIVSQFLAITVDKLL